MTSRICSNPECLKKGTKRCTKCLTKYYCSKECQVSNWKVHKSTCSPPSLSSQGSSYPPSDEIKLTKEGTKLTDEEVKEIKTSSKLDRKLLRKHLFEIRTKFKKEKDKRSLATVTPTTKEEVTTSKKEWNEEDKHGHEKGILICMEPSVLEKAMKQILPESRLPAGTGDPLQYKYIPNSKFELYGITEENIKKIKDSGSDDIIVGIVRDGSKDIGIFFLKSALTLLEERGKYGTTEENLDFIMKALNI